MKYEAFFNDTIIIITIHFPITKRFPMRNFLFAFDSFLNDFVSCLG